MARTVSISKVGITTIVETSSTENSTSKQRYFFNKKTNFFVENNLMHIENGPHSHPGVIIVSFNDIVDKLSTTNINDYANKIAENGYFTAEITA